MAEFTNDLLREAIADAEQVRETAIANAKLQLEESIAPTIKAELTKALSQTEEVEEAIQETEEVDEAHDPKGAKANDFAEVGEGVESADVADENSEVEIVSEDESATDDVVEGEATVSEETEEISEEVEEVEEAESVDEIDITVRGATTTVSGPDVSAPEIHEEEEEEEEEVVDDEEEDEDLEDLDLEAIIADLQREVDALEEDDEEEEEEIPPVEDDEEEEEVEEGDEEEVEVDDEEEDDEVEDDEEVDEDLDLDAILREIEAELSEEDETELAQENTRLQSELDEYRKAVELLRGKLNEVNLLNSKLLFTNKLFKGKELSQDQKIHVVETFDLATTIREVKLLYATLAEATINVPTKQKKQTTSTTEVVAEGIASKVVGGTAPTTEVLEEDQFAGFRSRMKELAGINVL